MPLSLSLSSLIPLTAHQHTHVFFFRTDSAPLLTLPLKKASFTLHQISDKSNGANPSTSPDSNPLFKSYFFGPPIPYGSSFSSSKRQPEIESRELSEEANEETSRRFCIIRRRSVLSLTRPDLIPQLLFQSIFSAKVAGSALVLTDR